MEKIKWRDRPRGAQLEVSEAKKLFYRQNQPEVGKSYSRPWGGAKRTVLAVEPIDPGLYAVTFLDQGRERTIKAASWHKWLSLPEPAAPRPKNKKKKGCETVPIECAVCGETREAKFYSWHQRQQEAPVCVDCQKIKGGKATAPTARTKRLNAARRTYCNRWDGVWLVKTCARYHESCGEFCYQEDENQQPCCFVEPQPTKHLSVRPTTTWAAEASIFQSRRTILGAE